MLKSLVTLASLTFLFFSQTAFSKNTNPTDQKVKDRTFANPHSPQFFASLDPAKSGFHSSNNGNSQQVQDSEILVQIKNHRFEPSEIKVAANQKFTLAIENLDSTLEEFESDDLKKEKLVGAGKKITIPINALKAGEYKFYGDFHQKTAQGKIIAK